ncbi:ABC transporter C family member 14 [Artemisia annua]|uniref:ABC transporter C family member 14 n=1 Tax=Artemisia annua TaxID=35608 RepID=A0A2U1MLG6_ARTAN|nr:ABC transporter C family member 14 [Artemisia annua]
MILVEYVEALEEIINKYCEESRKTHESHSEWIRKFKGKTDLNLKKLDARRMNVEVKPYVPPIPFPGRLKVVRQEETSKDQLIKMEVRSLQDEEAIPHANEESTTIHNGIISNSSFIANDVASFPIQVAELINEEAQPLTSQPMLITPPEDGYVTPTTEPILVEPEKELGGQVIYTTLNNKEANEAWRPITQPQHGVFISTNPLVHLGKVSGEMKSRKTKCNRYSTADLANHGGIQSLERCQLKDVVSPIRGKLDFTVKNGYNSSMGRGQLLCLGRVLSKHNNLLFMDESMTSIDS